MVFLRSMARNTSFTKHRESMSGDLSRRHYFISLLSFSKKHRKYLHRQRNHHRSLLLSASLLCFFPPLLYFQINHMGKAFHMSLLLLHHMAERRYGWMDIGSEELNWINGTASHGTYGRGTCIIEISLQSTEYMEIIRYLSFPLFIITCSKFPSTVLKSHSTTPLLRTYLEVN